MGEEPLLDIVGRLRPNVEVELVQDPQVTVNVAIHNVVLHSSHVPTQAQEELPHVSHPLTDAMVMMTVGIIPMKETV